MAYEKLPTVMNGKSVRKIGYKTEASFNRRHEGDVFYIYHHGSPIARITKGKVEVSNAGWGSRTTADRISRVLADNGIPVGVGIKNFTMEFRFRDEDYRTEPVPYDEWVKFSR